MTDIGLSFEPSVRVAEKEFYSRYEWCLNPRITVAELFERLQEELGRYTSLSFSWQREESRINLYLFVCAIGCATDDYLAWYPWILITLVFLFPRYHSIVTALEWLLNLPYRIFSFQKLRQLFRWKQEWSTYVDNICALLLRESDFSPPELSDLRAQFDEHRKTTLPRDLLKRRMKINEGFRCQDLTHHDIVTLVDRFLKITPSRNTKFLVIGPRTAGAYFAPIVKASLAAHGFTDVSWMTLRPKRGVSRREIHLLRRLLTPDVHIILTDDYSNSGLTLRLLQQLLYKYHVPGEKITILAPIHPAKTDTTFSECEGTRIVTIGQADLYKSRVLGSGATGSWLKEYIKPTVNQGIPPDEKEYINLTNERLWDHYLDYFSVRLKRLFSFPPPAGSPEKKPVRIIGKSVGWGWLGYHAYLAGTRLGEFVPPVVGLRDGILYTVWCEDDNATQGKKCPELLSNISLYVARRSRLLQLRDDPSAEAPDYGLGWMEILGILRRAYGTNLGHIRDHSLRRSLLEFKSPIPVLIDGRMGPGEWIRTRRGFRKTDFEHHNFGAPELDIVDVAYDLAAASFEFRLSDADERSMVQSYIAESGDESVGGRIIIYKLLYGAIAKRRALEGIMHGKERVSCENWNQRYLWSWNFLAGTMGRLCSSMIKPRRTQSSTGPLFFLDVDGILDSEVFGFPHTTLSGITALALLRTRGFLVLPNTGRGVENTRDYCSIYGLAGGIGEYGSVVFDAMHQSEISLMGSTETDQLEQCRAELRKHPDIYLDPTYHYAVRAYRFNPYRTIGLDARESEDVLKTLHLDRLSTITRSDDTYFVGKNISKGKAVEYVNNHVFPTKEPIAAIGDSQEDISMLKTAKLSFAPENCSNGIRELARQGKCHIVPHPHQRGLLSAVKEILRDGRHPRMDELIDPGSAGAVGRLFLPLLKAAEESRVEKLFTMLIG